VTATAPTLNSIDQARASGLNPLEYLRQRGYVHDVSDETGLREAFTSGAASGRSLTAYIGFDPSAPSLHVGNLVGIMMLASLQRFGHRPIALGGGGTALVGDPSGKTSTRKLITAGAIEENLAGVLPQFARYLDFAGGRFGDNPPALLLNNADWLLPLRYIEFLRDIGRHFSVNEMLAAETYRARLDTTGLNFVEFNYRIVQAYDFLHLYQTEGCRLQMGGSDQWGNIVAGVDLVRRVEGAKVFALVSPLITAAGGEKMGKSEGNAVWLDANLTSPYDYFQYWINASDADVARFLRLYTFVPEERIVELTGVTGSAIREAKRVLAFEATALTHGTEAAENAQQAARSLFTGRASPSAGDPSAPEGAIPTVEIDRAELMAGLTFADLFVRAGLTKSKGDARRLAAQGGLYMDDHRIESADAPFAPSGDGAMLRSGKKHHRRITIVE
jgi:tyrosyl-tRNA synthetase